MKHLKKFNLYFIKENVSTDITEDIAEDLLPRLQKIKSETGKFTVSDFEEYMKERKADTHTIDLVMSNLVSMGFDFDIDEEENIDDSDFDLKNKIY